MKRLSGQNGIHTALCGPLGQPECAFNHQNRRGGVGGIAPISPPWWRYCWLIPGLDRHVIQPASDGATIDEGFVVVAPVGDPELLLCSGTTCVSKWRVIGSFNSASVRCIQQSPEKCITSPSGARLWPPDFPDFTLFHKTAMQFKAPIWS